MILSNPFFTSSNFRFRFVILPPLPQPSPPPISPLIDHHPPRHPFSFSTHYPLPEEISQVSSLVHIEFMYNHFSGQILAKIKKLISLDFEGNFFSGTIPESLGSCVALNDTNLAGNSFSGHTPASLGSLRTLNSLNLSNNKLSGVIPASLSSLELSHIDLSNYMLTGRVPESFSAESYKGSFATNLELCSDRIKGLDKCSPVTPGLGVANYLIIGGAAVLAMLVLGFSIFCFGYKGKSRQKDATNQSPSPEMKQYHAGNFNEDKILIYQTSQRKMRLRC